MPWVITFQFQSNQQLQQPRRPAPRRGFIQYVLDTVSSLFQFAYDLLPVRGLFVMAASVAAVRYYIIPALVSELHGPVVCQQCGGEAKRRGHLDKHVKAGDKGPFSWK